MTYDCAARSGYSKCLRGSTSWMVTRTRCDAENGCRDGNGAVLCESRRVRVGFPIRARSCWKGNPVQSYITSSRRRPRDPAEILRFAEEDLTRVELEIRQQLSPEVDRIGEIGRYLLPSGGKRIRPIPSLLTAKLAGYAGERIFPLSAMIEFMHTATLLHDDVIDHSHLRRGHPTVNSAGAVPSPFWSAIFPMPRRWRSSSMTATHRFSRKSPGSP